MSEFRALGVWFHDGCAIDGDSCLKEEPSKSPTYFLLAVKDGFLCEDWEACLRKIKVTNKWTKLQFACRFHPGKEQLLRSCSMDACTVAIAILRDLVSQQDDLFGVSNRFAKVPRRGSSAGSVNMHTMALRNDFARLVVGALITFHDSKDSVWMGIMDDWKHQEDGIPEFADWDAAAVLMVLAACNGLTEAEIETCMKASYPEDPGLTLCPFYSLLSALSALCSLISALCSLLSALCSLLSAPCSVLGLLP